MAYGTSGYYFSWSGILSCNHNRIPNQGNFHLPAGSDSCYGRNVFLFTAGSIVILKFLRKKKLLLQDWKFYQYFRYDLPYKAERCRTGQHLYIKYRSFAHDLSMTVSIYFGMNDIMVNRYPLRYRYLHYRCSEECQTAIETFEKAISDNKVPVDKKAEETYLTIISRIDHGQIQIAEPGTLTEVWFCTDTLTDASV